MNSISEMTCPLTSGQTFTLELIYLEMFSRMLCTIINDHKGMNWVVNPIVFVIMKIKMYFIHDMIFSVTLPSGQSFSFRVSVT